jgi:hypothetical protein
VTQLSVVADIVFAQLLCVVKEIFFVGGHEVPSVGLEHHERVFHGKVVELHGKVVELHGQLVEHHGEQYGHGEQLHHDEQPVEYHGEHHKP